MVVERKPIAPHTEQTNQSYLDAILSIEQTCKTFGIDHRFVGGTLTDLLNTETQARIDYNNRRIYLTDYTPPQMFRSDSTVKDVDLICFPSRKSSFELAKYSLSEHERRGRKDGKKYPSVSIEPARGGEFPSANPLLQVVSGIERDGTDTWLTFDYMRQRIDPETLAAWKIVLTENGNASFTTLNPYAHILRYAMRVPSGIKKKDKSFSFDGEGNRFNKIMLMKRLAVQVKDEGEKYGVDYKELFRPWGDFIIAMRFDQSQSVAAKRAITQGYWDSIGTAIAHGKGIFSPLASLGDKFTG